MLRQVVLIILVIGIFGCFLAQPLAAADASWSIQKRAIQFDRHYVSDPDVLPAIQQAGNLKGKGNVVGWFEYDVKVPSDGWYELRVSPAANAHEVLIDGQSYTLIAGSSDKVGNFWLNSGAHAIRLQRYAYQGFSAIETITLKASEENSRSNCV